MYFGDVAEFDLAHSMGPKGTQQHQREELIRQVATLAKKVKSLQLPCGRIQIQGFDGDESEFDKCMKEVEDLFNHYKVIE